MCRGLARAVGIRRGWLLAIGRAMYVTGDGGDHGSGSAFVLGV